MPPQRRRRTNPVVVTDDTRNVALQGPVWNITGPIGVRKLVDEIFNTSRYRPILVVSQPADSDKPRVNIDDLLHVVTDHVYIAVLRSVEVGQELSNQVPGAFRVYGGAARILWPAASTSDESGRHPLFVTMHPEDSSQTIRYIRAQLIAKGYLDETAPKVPRHIVPVEQEPDSPWNRQPVPSLKEQERLEAAERELSALQVRYANVSTEAADLRKQVRGLQDTINELERKLHQRDVYADPAQQLEHEIGYAYLLTYNETDRATHPLAPYVFGSEFVNSVDTIEGVERDKIVSACLDVLTRRAWEINGRNARQLRESEVGNSGYVRRQDGAAGWRCNIQTGTASARRLMWWELTNGTIELALVALHDDVRIPE